MNGINNVIYLEEYRSKVKQKEKEKKEIRSVKKEIKEKVGIALQKRKNRRKKDCEVIPLVKTFTFKKSIDNPDSFIEIIDSFRKRGVSDIKVYRKDGTEILDPKDAVGEKTFTFSDEVSIFLLNFLSANNYHYKITKKGILVVL